MNFQPLGERVLVKVKEAQTTTASGIIIPDNASKEKPNEAEVVAIGPDVKHVEVGNNVMFSKFARSADLTIDGVDYLVMEVSEILGVMR